MQMSFYRANLTRYELLAPNVFIDYKGEMDIFAMRKSGYVDEIEIKISKSDFNADFKKTILVNNSEYDYRKFIEFRAKGLDASKYESHKKLLKHQLLESGELISNRFSFLLPEHLVDSCEIPDYAGLYVYRKTGYVRELKPAPLLHKKKIDDTMKYYVTKKLMHRYWDQLKEKETASLVKNGLISIK